MIKKEPDSLKLMRHLLGSIDLPDVEEKEESEIDRQAYCAAIAAVFPRLEKDIKNSLHHQLMFISNEAASWEQVIFGRGTFNGIDLLYHKWKQAVSEHESNNKDKSDDVPLLEP